MLKRISVSVLLLALLLPAGINAAAQSGEYLSYAPYSIFGIGDLAQQGSAYNRSMGGVGIASRNIRFLNSLNPAAVTAKDSLSFQLDFSVLNANTVFRQEDMVSARNITNLGSMAMSFPLWRSLSMVLYMTTSVTRVLDSLICSSTYIMYTWTRNMLSIGVGI